MPLSRHISRSLVVAAAAFLIPIAPASAARPPTKVERSAIVGALPAYVRAYPPTCARLTVRVSTNGRFASATPRFLHATKPPCSRYASNGRWLLARSARWKVVYDGSDPPPCSLGIPQGLVPCIKP